MEPPTGHPSTAGTSLPRLVATDLDRTLLGADSTIGHRSAQALAQAVDAGAVVVFVTGRSLRTLPRVYAGLNARYPAICAHGAVVYDADTDRVRRHQPLAAQEIRDVCHRLREHAPETVFAAAIDHGRKLLHEPGWPIHHTATTQAAATAELDQIAGNEAVKLMVRAPGIAPSAFHKLVDNAVGDIVNAIRPGRGGLIEMTQRGVTKAAALAAFAAELGIHPSDALAFGDMPGDIPMLRWAARSVAVANAHPAVRAAATDITLANTAHGVAHYLEQLFRPASNATGNI